MVTASRVLSSETIELMTMDARSRVAALALICPLSVYLLRYILLSEL